MNADYPAQGRWSFTVNRLVGNQSEAVSDVTVTDGVTTARAISFSTSLTERSRAWWSSGPSLTNHRPIGPTLWSAWVGRDRRLSAR